ncbi:MAG: TetR/AcrR family transcriptional regulator [Ideonella sp.]|jgi:TetR/AcrR family transcriptional repressor of nem operon|nr:TetR/AcrR family transcriptional regulator [Ideonella sp.]
MRVSREQMAEGHRRIVEGASRLMRERGVDRVSVADAMKEAGLTHGGFYRHFRDKDELVVAALRRAFEEFIEPFERQQLSDSPRRAADEYRRLYLSAEHVAHAGRGCPMPALASDVARGSQDVRDGFSNGLRRIVDAMARAQRGSEEQRQRAACRELAMLVGAVVLARASDTATADQILDACRDA